MSEQFLVNLPDYWKMPVKPRGFTEFCEMYETQGKVTGIWEWKQWDPKTGEVRKREWTLNTVTDRGANNIFQAAINTGVPAAVFNNIYINNNSASTVLSGGGLGAGATTSIPVVATPAAFPLNYPAGSGGTIVNRLTLGYGLSGAQTVTASALLAVGGTAFTVVSFTSTVWAGGTPIVPAPDVNEDPTNANLKANTPTGGVKEFYSGNITNAGGNGFTYAYTGANSGAGNRSVTIVYIFKDSSNGGTTPDASYTDAWLCNTTSAAGQGNYVCHEVNTPMQVNSSNNVTVSITIKI